MINEEIQPPSNMMEQIRERLIAMGYIVRSSISSSRMLYATNDSKGELHVIVLEGKSVRVNDIKGIHEAQRHEIEIEVQKCLNQ
jgi:hypothetical protein